MSVATVPHFVVVDTWLAVGSYSTISIFIDDIHYISKAVSFLISIILVSISLTR